jgi:REP element-mobilizing transposase RayT
MPPPDAYFLTWTTYATRLHGHADGSTDHAREGHGTTRLKPSPKLLERRKHQASEPPFILNPTAREAVERAVRDLAAHKNWPILALAVRSNHIHLLIRSLETPEQVMTSCKSWSTRALRESGLLGDRTKVWTRHASTRWINNKDDLVQAYKYITDWQEGDLAKRRYVQP